MLQFDFDTYYNFNRNDENKLEELKNKLYKSDMSGWLDNIDEETIINIKKVASEIKEHSQCLVVIGIGGSFLGSKAVAEMLCPYFNDNYFKVIYAGNNLSSKYLSELIEYLKGVDFSINVISKSGTTMEPSIAYQYIKEIMVEKYSKDEILKRIIMTTDEVSGTLRAECNKEGYKSFIIPSNIGGRYSIITAAHLLPLALNIDIDKFIAGYYDGIKYIEDAYRYALSRVNLFNNGFGVESYTVYEENMYYFAEWIKQLYGETEGKDGKGLFPVSTIQPRDLHSLGQFIQSGNKILFETFIKVKESLELSYKSASLHDVNNLVLDSVRKAHFKGDVPSMMIELEKVCEYSIGQLMMFFMLGAAFSAYLFDVEPFDQPGVEVYKEEVRNSLKNL